MPWLVASMRLLAVGGLSKTVASVKLHLVVIDKGERSLSILSF